MSFYTRIYSLVAGLVLLVSAAQAQNRPIGYWRAHLPYNQALGVAVNGNMAFAITNTTFFTYDMSNEQTTGYSKIDGMSDMEMRCIGYDVATSTAILVYANGNIDVFKDNTFYNIPDLKTKSVAGSKEVYGVYIENGYAYLSTSLGILVIDLSNYTVAETYQFIRNNQTIPVTGLTALGAHFYASTPFGLYRAEKANPALQNFAVWTRIDSTKILNSSATQNNVLHFATDSSIYVLESDTLRMVFKSNKLILHIDAGNNGLLVSEYLTRSFSGDVLMLNANYQRIDSTEASLPLQALQLTDGALLVADGQAGLSKSQPGQKPTLHFPQGPNNINSFDIYAHNKTVWVAHGGYDERYVPNQWGYGMSRYNGEGWQPFKTYSFYPFGDSVQDIVQVVQDEKDGTLYAGSFVSGIFVLKPDFSYQILKQNSVLDTSRSVYGQGQRQVIGLGLDKNDNLWVSTAFSQHQLYVKTPDSVWKEIIVPNSPANGGQLTIDDDGQVWFINSGIGGGGITVYNPVDSTGYHLATGTGFGNLPSNDVFCLAKDNNNNIWVGTANGIGIVSNCNSPFTQNPPCDAEIPIVQYDQFAGYLFADNIVRTIAVDGANRKWVGTDNGVWLLSADASQIVYRFTAENSPLPSNSVRKIAIDKVTGDVYIGTDRGMVSYHSTATEGGTTNENALVYPNPVTSDYKGTIAIKGLVANGDVRITDIAGQLVYRTKALGGQAVWSGNDYTGHRPQTGVYLIFVTNTDGSQKYAGKVVFIH